MARYWVAIHFRVFDAMAVEDPEMDRAIDELNDAMVAAGVRTFVSGLQKYTLAVRAPRPQHPAGGPAAEIPKIPETSTASDGAPVEAPATPPAAIQRSLFEL